MPTARITLDILVDGLRLRGFPKYIAVALDELQEFDYEEPGDSNNTTFSALPVTQVDTVQALLVQAVDAVNVRVEGGESGSVAIPLAEGGMILILGSSLTNTNCTINVNSADVARVKGFGGGT